MNSHRMRLPLSWRWAESARLSPWNRRTRQRLAGSARLRQWSRSAADQDAACRCRGPSPLLRPAPTVRCRRPRPTHALLRMESMGQCTRAFHRRRFRCRMPRTTSRPFRARLLRSLPWSRPAQAPRQANRSARRRLAYSCVHSRACLTVIPSPNTQEVPARTKRARAKSQVAERLGVSMRQVLRSPQRPAGMPIRLPEKEVAAPARLPLRAPCGTVPLRARGDWAHSPPPGSDPVTPAGSRGWAARRPCTPPRPSARRSPRPSRHAPPQVHLTHLRRQHPRAHWPGLMDTRVEI